MKTLLLLATTAMTFGPNPHPTAQFYVHNIEWIGDVQWLGQISYTHKLSDEERRASVEKWKAERMRNGEVAVGSDDGSYLYISPEYDMTFSKDVELGLREDGVVVWRKRLAKAAKARNERDGIKSGKTP